MTASQSTQGVSIGIAVLRFASFGAKLALTLYMGRYLSLADIGTYGLVFGAVMILTIVLGCRLDYVMSRDLVRVSSKTAALRMRDQTVFYAIHYLIAAVCMGCLIVTDATATSSRILGYVLAVTITNSCVDFAYSNLNSMEKPLLANALFFMPGGAWCIAVIALGIAEPHFRSVDTILLAWIAGNVAFCITTCWVLRRMPWGEAFRQPVDWGWMAASVRKSFPYWIGMLGLSVGGYTDRFVLMHFVGLDEVGIATFYLSLAGAIWTLVQATVLAVAYPRLVAAHRDGLTESFRHEVQQATNQVLLLATCVGVAVGVAVPLFGNLFGRPEFATYAPVLWMIICAMWIKANAELLYQVLFARRQDRAIWLGNLLYLVPAVAATSLFVWLFGFYGIGVGALIASLFIYSWRIRAVRRYSLVHDRPPRDNRAPPPLEPRRTGEVTIETSAGR
jgi:O-antigen/teichoic acid export membrane protein